MIKDLYAKDDFFSSIIAKLDNCHEHASFFLDNGYLFRAGKLCIPKSSFRYLLLKEAHDNRGHFGATKNALREHFFWPHMARDVFKYFFSSLSPHINGERCKFY